MFSGEVRAVAGVDLEVAEGEIYAFLGPERRRQDDDGPDADDAAAPDRRAAPGRRLRRRRRGRRGAPRDRRRAPGGRARPADDRARADPPPGDAPRAARASEGRRRADALLERVDLVDAADRQVGTYSGGMRRRLDLASALVHEPRGAVPRRADHGAGPGEPQDDLGGGRAAQRRGHDGLPHHPVPGGGRPARRPGRDHRRRQDRRRGHARAR